ncbi:MAG: tetratricopeptide repeat protein, partial [bacterium]|nr:tetratricopeptide repeat protein [bacterium]
MADKKQTEINTQEPDAERSLTLLLKETEGNFDSLPDAKKEEIKKQYLSLYDKIQDIQESPDLAKVLELLSWSGSSPMGLSLMAALLETAEPELTEPLSIGNSLGLLYKQPGDSAGYGVHALPRTLCREKKPISDNKQWVEDVSQKLGQWFEARRKEYGQSDAFEQELLHLREWLTHITPISPYHSGRLTWLGAYESYHNGDYEESRQLVQKALSILEKSEKPAHKLNADMLIDLGYIYGELDNHAEALKSQQTAYDLLTAEVGEEHEDTADLLDSIAGIFDGLGKKDEAIAKYERALEIRKKIFGL